MEPKDHHPLAPLVSTGITAATLFVAFGLMSIGIESFWVVFVVGFGGLLPISLGLLEYRRRERTCRRERSDSDTALAKLRERYVRGEITETEFEQRVENLMETPASAHERTDISGVRTETGRERTGSD